MVVQHNSAAQLALGELNKNISKVGDLLAKISSGQKINFAKDDAASFAISEKMREQIRSLTQDNQNVQNGSSLVRIAEEGINNIVEELRNLKELAINAANDTNTDGDRAIIQKEFSQKMANINDIATMTNYNGIPLLDGTWYRKANYEKVYSLSQTEPSPVQDIVSITQGNKIDADGIYVIPRGYSGTIAIDENAKNIEIQQEDPNTPLEGVYIVGPAGGGANIWLNNLNIRNYYDGSIVKFQGKDNYLTIIGENTITYYGTNLDYNASTINIGDGLTLEGTGSLTVRNTGYMTCSAVGVDQQYYNSDTNIIINSGTYDFYVNEDGGAIGGSIESEMGDIIINGGNITVYSKNGAGIGGTGYANATWSGEFCDNTVGNIIIGKDAVINATSVYGAGIGTGTSQSYVNSIQISKWADVTSKSQYAEDIGRGLSGRLGSLGVSYFDDSATKSAEYELKLLDYVWNPLTIHHGPKDNQAIHIFINDMHTKSLGTGNLLAGSTFFNTSDEDRYYALSYDKNKQAAWLETLTLAQNKTLDDISVTTKQNANVAIRVLDGALEYALNEATMMGSYLQRLEYMDANITTMGENIQSAESVIRDADMAKTMTEYTKFNVLTQSAQAMLAQANQSSSQVLSLLQ